MRNTYFKLIGTLILIILLVGCTQTTQTPTGNVVKQTTQEKFAKDLSKAIVYTLPEVTDTNLTLYNDDPNKIVVSITYYFKEKWLVDNYLQVMSDASDLFEAVFPVDPVIYQIKIMAKEKFKDDYGYTQERYLARTSMDRETYNKINWEEFDSAKLDKTTSVSYYGDSFYKELKDLEEDLETLQTISTNVPTDVLVDICSIEQEECREYGECEDYEFFKSQGIC